MTSTLNELGDLLGPDAITQLRCLGMLDGDRPSLKAYAHGLAVKIPYGERTDGKIAHAYCWFPEACVEDTDT